MARAAIGLLDSTISSVLRDLMSVLCFHSVVVYAFDYC